MAEDNTQAVCVGGGVPDRDSSDATTINFIIQNNLGAFKSGGTAVTNNRTVRKLRNHASERAPNVVRIRVPERGYS